MKKATKHFLMIDSQNKNKLSGETSITITSQVKGKVEVGKISLKETITRSLIHSNINISKNKMHQNITNLVQNPSNIFKKLIKINWMNHMKEDTKNSLLQNTNRIKSNILKNTKKESMRKSITKFHYLRMTIKIVKIIKMLIL